MKMGLLKFSKEVKHLIYSIIILAIVFGFNDGSDTFVLSNWLYNFVLTLFLVSIVILTFMVGIKIASNLFGYEVKFCIWELKKFFFSEKARFPLTFKLFGKGFFKIKNLHLGVIVALFLTLVSNGILYFTAISTFCTEVKKKIGKERVYLKDSTESSIALISLIFILLLIVIFKMLNIKSGLVISSWFIIWNLLPIGPLLGSKIFFNSRTIYLGTLIFMVLFLSIVSIIPWVFSLIIGLFFSIIAMIVYFYKIEYFR